MSKKPKRMWTITFEIMLSLDDEVLKDMVTHLASKLTLFRQTKIVAYSLKPAEKSQTELFD